MNVALLIEYMLFNCEWSLVCIDRSSKDKGFSRSDGASHDFPVFRTLELYSTGSKQRWLCEPYFPLMYDSSQITRYLKETTNVLARQKICWGLGLGEKGKCIFFLCLLWLEFYFISCYFILKGS